MYTEDYPALVGISDRSDLCYFLLLWYSSNLMQLLDGSPPCTPLFFLAISSLYLCPSTHEQSGLSLGQRDTRPESLKHHLGLNYSLCQ